MATPIQNKNKWARLRQVAADEPKEAGGAIAELAEALGVMADSLQALRTNLDLTEAPKTASPKARILAARRYASRFRQIANESPEVMADALSEVYHALDDVAGAVENLAENLGIDLNLSPVEEEFDDEAGHIPEEPVIDEEEFEEGEEELKSPDAEPAEEELDEEINKEAAGGIEFVTDRDETGKPKAPVIAAAKKAATHRYVPATDSRVSTANCATCGKHRDNACHTSQADKDKEDNAKANKEWKAKQEKKKADGSAGFVTDRGNDSKPEAPVKTDTPKAQGESEVNKAAARRLATRQRIAKRWGVTV